MSTLPVVYIDEITPEDRPVPDGWNHDQAADRVRELVHEIVEVHRRNDTRLARELRWAQKALSNPGARTDRNLVPTFEAWLKGVGLPKSTAYKIIARYDVLTDKSEGGTYGLEKREDGRVVETKPRPESDDVDEDDEPRPDRDDVGDGEPRLDRNEVGDDRSVKNKSNELSTKSKREEYVAQLKACYSDLEPPPDLDEAAAAEVVKQLRRIQRQAGKLAKAVTSQFGDEPERTEEDHRLYGWLRDQFAERNPFPLDMRVESQFLWRLVTNAKHVDDPDGFLVLLLDCFYELTQSADAFWGKQPFLPRALAGKLFVRVIPHMESKANGRMTAEQLAGLKEIYGEG